jgi:hypothetical protein
VRAPVAKQKGNSKVAQEPSGTLWDAVRAAGVRWPETNEEAVTRIADGWDTAFKAFEPAGGYPISDIANFWPDAAGTAFISRTRADLKAAADSATAMATLAGNTRFFADEVTHVKQRISSLMRYYQGWYDFAVALQGIGAPASMAQQVVELASHQARQAITDAIGHINGLAAVHPVTVPIHMPSQVPLPGTPPADVKRWWDGLSQPERDEILQKNPDAIRNLDGIPAAVRDKANRLVLPREIDALRVREAELSALVAEQRETFRNRNPGDELLVPQRDSEQELAAVQKRIASLEELRKRGIHTEIGELERQEAAIRNDPALSDAVRTAQLTAVQGELVNARGFRDQRQLRSDEVDEPNRPPILLLGLDTADDGRAIVSIGDPDKAQNVATWVPGSLAELGGIHEPNGGGELGRTERMYDAATRAGSESTAVVTWLDYDAPDAILPDAGYESYAEDGRQALAEFQEGLRATHESPNSHNTVVGHSYGTTTLGHAARDIGLNADDVALVASPGTGTEHVSELRLLRPDGSAYTPEETADRVHATVAENDVIQWTNDLSEKVPRVPIYSGVPGEPPVWVDTPYIDLVHGRDPTSEEFGAGDNTFYTRPRESGVDSHSAAFESGNPALDTIGQIIAGTRVRR